MWECFFCVWLTGVCVCEKKKSVFVRVCACACVCVWVWLCHTLVHTPRLVVAVVMPVRPSPVDGCVAARSMCCRLWMFGSVYLLVVYMYLGQRQWSWEGQFQLLIKCCRKLNVAALWYHTNDKWRVVIVLPLIVRSPLAPDRAMNTLILPGRCVCVCLLASTTLSYMWWPIGNTV